MSDIHTITLTGNVGGDPEFKTVGETDLAVFSLAVTQYRGPNREKDTAWWRIQLWGARSKVADYIKTGMKLTIVGRAMVDTWFDDDDNKRHSYYVDADDIVLPSKGDGAGSDSGSSSSGRSRGKGRGGKSSSSKKGSSKKGGKKPRGKQDDLPF